MHSIVTECKCTVLWDIKGSEEYFPLKKYQLKVSQETGSEANIGFGCALMTFYLEMRPPLA